MPALQPRRVAPIAVGALIAACVGNTGELPPGPALHSFAGATWNIPSVLPAPVNSRCADQTPTLSRDELALYFTSDRPGGSGALLPNGCQSTTDLWVARRESRSAAWSEAVVSNLGSTINTAANEVAPALSVDGHLLFFSSDRAPTAGQNDIWVSRRQNPNDDLAWETPVGLGSDVNTADFESGPHFMQSGEVGAANLWFYRGSSNNITSIHVAAIDRDGSTSGPAELVETLAFPNTANGFVSVRQDGRELFFNSSRPGGLNAFDMWTSTRPSKHAPWSTPVLIGPPVNSTFPDFQPDLSHDGRTLLFISGAGRGGLGMLDMWIATRDRGGM
jgi:Tol biopolymer transport system component